MTSIFWTFTLLIMLAPLPFGMVHELLQALFAFLVFTLVGALCVYRIQNDGVPGVPLRRVIWETTAFAVVLGWAMVIPLVLII